MKNRVICLILACLIAVGVAACSSEKQPADCWSDEAIDACLDTIEIIQDVIDGEMEPDKANIKIEAIAKHLNGEEFYDSLMAINIKASTAYIKLYGDDFSTVTKRDLEQKINDLEEALYNY